MSDYKEMYLELFNEVTRAIEVLQSAQQKVEEMYISGDVEGKYQTGSNDE